MKLRWRYGIIAGIFLAIFSLYPQFKMFYLRGSAWQGHYAYNDIDEVAYASYLKALIDGRPRKNDPYTGRDDSPQNPQPESLFSIQFAGPYTIAIPSRILGIPATWAMTISGALAAFLTAFAIFWFIGLVTGDSLFAMAGSLFVLCGGAIFAGEGAIGEVLFDGFSYPYFPGFRRYIPAMAFPAFFVLVGLVWKIFGGDEPGNTRGRRAILIALASAAFGYTVFSYFYVWTTAAAWLGSVGILLLITSLGEIRKLAKTLFPFAAACGLFLIPYAYLLSRRSHTMDEVQLLVRTHAFDFQRVPEYVCFITLALLAGGLWSKKLVISDRAVVFAISLALAPILVFNQQVLTGQSLQPIHYEVFIGNYVAGLAFILTIGLMLKNAGFNSMRFSRFAYSFLALIAITWGFVECHYTVRVLDDVNVIRDEALPVAQRLAELAKSDPKPYESVVLNFGIAEADDMPTIAPQPVLWAHHQHVFAGVTWQENKERYYQYLNYQGIPPGQIADGMKNGGDFVSMIALFGWGRHTDRLNSAYKPLTFGEIDDEAAKYSEYCRTFTLATPGAVPLSYLVANIDQTNFENVDKYYERDAGEAYGKYVLFRLKPR